MYINKKGLTWIEIAAIIAAVVVLGYLGFLSLNNAQKRARDAERVESVNRLRDSLFAYLKAEKKMPANPKPGELWCGDDQEFLKELADKGYIPQMPQAPKGDKFPFCYYDYGPDNTLGGVVGVKMEISKVEPVCQIDRAPFWCGREYYCRCQPYSIIIQ
ncbi:MAG: hypothetical protein HY602_03525 [Parcubacteria group bacterium]|nr:hypothetical protein [Parcubacteria group bacterium]